MKTKRILKAFTISVVGSLILTFSATAPAFAKTYRWRIQSHWPGSSSSYKASLEVVAKQIKEATGGRLIWQTFSAGSLIPSKEIFNAVKRGMIEGGTTAPAYFRDQVEIAGIAAGLPYSFKTVWEAAYFHEHYGFEKMLRDAIAKHGVFWSTDKAYPTALVINRPISTVEELKKLKLRSSGVLQRWLTDVGAAASYLPASELYPALASGVMDGAHWGAAQGAYSMKLYDVCKYHLEPAISIGGTDGWAFNQKAIDALPKDVQEIFYLVMKKHFWERTNEYVYMEKKTLAKAIKEKGVKVVNLPPAEQQKLTEVGMKIWEEEGKKGPEAAKALKMLKDYLKELGHL